jgi:uncharacterized membrane protein YqhA
VSRLEAGFEAFLALARFLVLIPVIVLVLAAAAIFGYATVVFFASMPGLFGHPVPVGHKLSVFVVEIDLFLIGATLIIAAFGFYELFISKVGEQTGRRSLPAWLAMRDLNDLKIRVASMLILVAAVTFVDLVLEKNPGPGILYLGAGVALVITALVAFIRFGSESDGSSAP